MEDGVGGIVESDLGRRVLGSEDCGLESVKVLIRWVGAKLC
jgi:hypothetical protein